MELALVVWWLSCDGDGDGASWEITFRNRTIPYKGVACDLNRASSPPNAQAFSYTFLLFFQFSPLLSDARGGQESNGAIAINEWTNCIRFRTVLLGSYYTNKLYPRKSLFVI